MKSACVSEKFANFLRSSAGNSVRYEAVNAMLLNEFLKAHRRMEEQDKRIEELTAQLEQQAAQIQKVSAQLAKDESVRVADSK